LLAPVDMDRRRRKKFDEGNLISLWQWQHCTICRLQGPGWGVGGGGGGSYLCFCRKGRPGWHRHSEEVHVVGGQHEADLKGVLVTQHQLVHHALPQVQEHHPLQAGSVPLPVMNRTGMRNKFLKWSVKRTTSCQMHFDQAKSDLLF